MDKDLVHKELGAHGDFDLSIVAGNLQVKVDYAEVGLIGSVAIALDSDKVIDKLKALIPGVWDDGLWDLVKAALKK